MEIASPPIELPYNDHTRRWHDETVLLPHSTSGHGDQGDEGSVGVQGAACVRTSESDSVVHPLFDTERLHPSLSPGRRVDQDQGGQCSESVDESGAADDAVVVMESRMDDPRRAWGLVVGGTGARPTAVEVAAMTVQQCIECVFFFPAVALPFECARVS